MHENITYNPLQQETIKHINSDSNLIISAPTSSGKTIVAEQFMFTALSQGKRALYLSPLKALTNEKYEMWKEMGLSLVAITSDHERSPRPITERLILMTTEALDSKSRGAKSWLKEVGVIICDEAHLLGAPKRGDAFEVGLTRFSQINPKARIVTLSATLPNVEDIKTWLTDLNGKPTIVVETAWRPVTQTHHLIKTFDREWEFNQTALENIAKIRQHHSDSQILIFVHTVAKGHQIAKHFSIPFHYSKIGKDERHFLEQSFRDKKLMTLVSTSTLAYGINLPADVGIIIGGHRGPVMVEPWDIKQMAGRIGRYGLSTEGQVYYIFKRNYASELYDQLTNMPPIESQLPPRLYFHLTSFIAREGMQLPQIRDFISRTLASHQYTLHIEEALDLLMQYEIIRKTDEGALFPSLLGKASAYMYVDPIDLFYLKRNLQDHPLTPGLVARAFADIPSYAYETFVPDDLQCPIEMPYGQQTIIASCLYEWLLGRDLSPTASVIIPPFIMDIERWTSALTMAGLDKAYTKNLSLTVQYGIEENLLELVSIPGIGRKRALDLSRFSIYTKADMLKHYQIAQNIVGKKIMLQIQDQKERPGKIILRF